MKQLFFTLTFLFPICLQAQIITTVAGCGIGDDSLATKAEIVQPMKIVFDQSGNAYIADAGLDRIRKVSASGIITTFAGTGANGYTGDGGSAMAATFDGIFSVAVDRVGNVYIADAGNSVIRKINTSGIISTVAGTGVAGYGGDGGPATAAQLNQPSDVLVDTSGNIFIADRTNYRVRKVDASGVITTVPGSTGITGTPFRIAMDATGNLFIGCYGDWYIYKLDTAGTLISIAGTGAYGSSGDGGPATAARFTAPCGLVVDATGNVYFSDIDSNRVRMISAATGIITTIAGNGVAGYGGDGGPASAAEISSPEGISFDADNNLYIADLNNNRIREVAPAGTISTFAGQNGLFGEGYPATNAEMTLPGNLATDAEGNVYIVDAYNSRIRMMNVATGMITTVAGSGISGYEDGFSGDGGPATSADLQYPAAVVVDVSGNIYIADAGNNRIRKVNTSGIITTVAGNGISGYSGDNGPAAMAELNNPGGVAVDLSGNIYIADASNNRVRKVNTLGVITTVAGNGIAAYRGDGGQATVAEIQPADVAIDRAGNIYIADGNNSRVRLVDTAGIITTIAGNGIFGYSGDGSPATSAEIEGPGGIKVDASGNVFFNDGSNRIRMINTVGIISTVAGNGTPGFSGDGGPALSAMINEPTGVAVDGAGNLYIADGNNFRVRKVSLSYLSVATLTKVSHGISVYPNPATNMLTVTFLVPMTDIIIANLLGQTVHSETGNAIQVQVDVSDLPTGVYFIRVNGTEVRKFVKE